jgi:cytochrome P450
MTETAKETAHGTEPPDYDYDQFDEKLAKCPFGKWTDMQSNHPVVHTGAHGGFYVLSRFADCNKGLRTPKVYSSASGVTLPPTSGGNLIPAEVDPPDHRKYRQLVNAWFTPKAVAKFEPYLRERAAELIDAAVTKKSFDIVEDLAEPIPRTAAFELLGFPRVDQPRVSRLIGESLGIGVPAAEMEARIAQGQAGLVAYITGVVEERRKSASADDLTSAIVHGQIDGRALDDTEILMTMMLMIYAGLHTTSVAMAGMLYWLGENPDGAERLKTNPELIDSAIEEFVRWTTPSGNQCRTLTEDVELYGYTLKAGKKVMLLDEAANRDPEKFERPQDVVLDRSPNPHLGWGAGPHRCAGEHLGRLEMRIVLEEWLARVPRYEIDYDNVIWVAGNARGLGSCPVHVMG